MPSRPLAVSLARRCALLGAPALIARGDDRYRNPPYHDRDGTTAVGAFNLDQMAGDDPALLDALDEAIAPQIRFARSISGKPRA